MLNMLRWQISDQLQERRQIIRCNSKMYSHLSSFFHLDQKRQCILRYEYVVEDTTDRLSKQY